MSKTYFWKRQKDLFDYERSLKRKEIAVTKALHEHNKQLKIIQSKIDKQRKDLLSFITKVERLKRTNSKLEALNDKLEAELQQDKRKQQQERVDSTEQKSKKLECILHDMDNLYTFRNITKIFFNIQKLPKKIQGFSVRDKENAWELLPFKIDPQEHTHEDVMDIIYEKLLNTGIYRKHWQYVVFGNCVYNETNDRTETK